MIRIITRLICAAVVVGGAAFALFGKIDMPQMFAAKKVQISHQFDEHGYWRGKNFLLKKNPDNSIAYYGTNSLYGNYLAGRIAHMRQDFENATEYYKLALEKDKDNQRLNRIIYVLLTSLGQIDVAEPYALQELEETVPALSTVETDMEARELTRYLNRYLEQLDSKDRYLFLRRYWYGDGVGEIAQNLNTTPHAVSVRLFRLREKLQFYLQKEGMIG